MDLPTASEARSYKLNDEEKALKKDKYIEDEVNDFLNSMKRTIKEGVKNKYSRIVCESAFYRLEDVLKNKGYKIYITTYEHSSGYKVTVSWSGNEKDDDSSVDSSDEEY